MSSIYLTLTQHAVFLATLYLLFSMAEWFVHRHLMHGSPDKKIARDHLTHHLRTRPDMSLTVPATDGLFFTWSYSIAILLVGLAIAFVAKLAFPRVTPAFVFICVLFFWAYQSSMWNTIHPRVHGVAGQHMTWREGIPGWSGWTAAFSRVPVGRYTSLDAWLLENHAKHHRIKGPGKGNYNITLPLADFVFGTYN